MISLVVCSKNRIVDSKLSENISSTIGEIEYEIVWIDNSQCQYSIFEAYNVGVSRAKYPILCFIHEDIYFKNDGWGAALLKSFSDESIGMVGVVGSYYLDKYSTSWSSSGLCYGNYYQGKIESGKRILSYHKNELFKDLGCYVSCIDGLFMAIPRELFTSNKIHWDDKLYDGFHFYDLDISMQINSIGKKILVNNDITIVHYSEGSYNVAFYDNCMKFHTKWNEYLPFSSVVLDNSLKDGAEISSLKHICDLGKQVAKSERRLSLWPYKIATKLCLLLKKQIW